MATGDKLVTLDGLKAAYDAVVHTDEYARDMMNVSKAFTENKIIGAAGAVTTNNANKCTKYIAVKKGDVLKYRLRASYPIAAYESDKSTVADVVARPSGQTWAEGNYTFFTQQENGEDKYPDGYTGYFRACTYAAYISEAYAYIEGALPDAVAQTVKGLAADVQKNATDIGAVAEGLEEIDARCPELHLSKNKYYQITTQPGRLTSATTVASNSANMTTDYIDVSGFVNKVCVSPRVRAWAEYLSDKSVNTSAEENGFHDFGTARRIPVLSPHENTVYIRITLYSADTDIQIEDGTECTFYEAPAFAPAENITLNDTQRAVVSGMTAGAAYNPLHGKKWAVCGDSFTKGAFARSPVEDYTIESGMYAGAVKTYCNLIANRNEMTLQNLSYGGMTMATPASGDYHNAFSDNNATYFKYKDIAADADYITLYYGINDQHHINQSAGDDGEDVTGVITIGEITDTVTSTFYGAYNTVMKWIRENRPFAHVGIIVTNGASNDIANATIAIAKKWGVPYINLNGDERTPAMIRSTNPNLSESLLDTLFANQAVRPVADNTVDPPLAVNAHPNAKAHEFESHFIEAFLKTL